MLHIYVLALLGLDLVTAEVLRIFSSFDAMAFLLVNHRLIIPAFTLGIKVLYKHPSVYNAVHLPPLTPYHHSVHSNNANGLLFVALSAISSSGFCL